MNWSILLQIYSLSELLEVSELTEEEVLEVLYDLGMLRLPEPLPVGFDVLAS